MANEIQPYKELRELSPDLWCLDGEWYETAFARRMTVMRLRDGGLVIHNAIQLRDEDYSWLDRLGPVRAVIVPNAFHGSDAHFYLAKYPEAKLFVPEKRVKKWTGARALETDWPFENEIPRVVFEKTLAHETAFIHLASRTLVLTDMSFNMPSSAFKSEMERLVVGKWNGILDQLGPSRMTRLLIARNRKALSKALRQIAAFDFDRVIVNHGAIVERDGKELFLEGFRRVYGEEIIL